MWPATGGGGWVSEVAKQNRITGSLQASWWHGGWIVDLNNLLNDGYRGFFSKTYSVNNDFYFIPEKNVRRSKTAYFDPPLTQALSYGEALSRQKWESEKTTKSKILLNLVGRRKQHIYFD